MDNHQQAEKGNKYKDPQKIIHDLRVHQIELERQNQELKATQQELERYWERYIKLYDFAQVGHLIFDTKGAILEFNLTAANQLGVKKSALLHKPIMVYLQRESHKVFYDHIQKVIQQPEHQICELKIKTRDADGKHGHFQ
jgi:PAS domain S-box-containing protein